MNSTASCLDSTLSFVPKNTESFQSDRSDRSPFTTACFAITLG